MPQNDGRNKLKRMAFEFRGNTYTFKLNPEEYTQEEPQRSVVTQTKGGAWIDDFGSGLTTIFMRGSTGFKNGFENFKELRDTLREYKDNIVPGSEVVDELTFHNFTDEESFIVHVDPSGFKLFRSKSNPLMYMYEVRLICLRPYGTPAPKARTKGEVSSGSSSNKSTDEAIKEVSSVVGLSPNNSASSKVSEQWGKLQISNDGTATIRK